MIDEIAPRDKSRGVVRFVVRGPGFVPLTQAAALREKYNEYPSRYPLDPRFPSPGRRGGSRPKPDQSAPGADSGDGGGGGLQPGSGSGAPAGSFPYPRGRGGSDLISSGGVLPPPGSPLAHGVNACVGGGGTFFTRAISVVAGATTVLVSNAVSRPFVIRHAQGFGQADFATGSNLTIKIAQDTDTTGGAATTGTNIEGLGIQSATFSALGVSSDIYPNVRWTVVPAYIKFILGNFSAATLFFYMSIELDYLD